jgi:hypothetical protein
MTTPSTRTGGSGIEDVMIVRDEELNLAHTLPSIVGWADRVWVVDSGSTDRTVEVPALPGARWSAVQAGIRSAEERGRRTRCRWQHPGY